MLKSILRISSNNIKNDIRILIVRQEMMKNTGIMSAAVLLAATIAVADSDIPNGRLGFPLGTYLTITGKTPEPGRMKVNVSTTLMVEKVSGKELDQPVSVVVENLGSAYFPTNTTITIRGYETGRMIGVPWEVAEKEDLPVPQAAWQFYRTFVFTSSVTPEQLPTKSSNYMERKETREKIVEPAGGAYVSPAAGDPSAHP